MVSTAGTIQWKNIKSTKLKKKLRTIYHVITTCMSNQAPTKTKAPTNSDNLEGETIQTAHRNCRSSFPGLTLGAGSLITGQDRRRAGLVFVLGTPIMGFCGSPDAGFLVSEKIGDGVFDSPFRWIAFGLSLLFGLGVIL